MNKTKMTTLKGIVLLLVLIMLLGCVAGCGNAKDTIQEIPAEDTYSYVNPDETKAETDAGFTIDGVADEAAYQNNHWLYLRNDDGGNEVNIAMTSYFGEKGMYFVYDVTETVPIYVNLDRASYLNSCIEMYFAPSTVTATGQNSMFEVDLMPTGDMVFKKSNGKGSYVDVATTNDIMAHLGTTTKGGEVNTESCNGYCLELFIPWAYMEWNGLDAEAMKQSFVYVNPAHITSFNHGGLNKDLDRYWYFYAQQQGAGFGNVYQYFRFDENGVQGSVPVVLEAGANCSVTGNPSVLPGMETSVTITPNAGYALDSILVDGKEYIQNVSYQEDGSVILSLRPGAKGLKISASAAAITDSTKTITGKVILNNPEKDSLDGIEMSYIGPKGEKPVELDQEGNFVLKDLQQGYYTLKVEKENYQTISRGVDLRMDRNVELLLERDTFYTQSGTAFILDKQNEGVAQKFGGTGYILSNQQYNRFTYEMKIRYDEALAKEANADAFTQQRTGMRILFSNGKYWHIDLLKSGDQYILQYADHGETVFEKWSTLCTLNQYEIAQYKSKDGISLKMVRDGRFAGIYLGGKLLRVEKLPAEYSACTAQVGMESWSANRTVLDIPYSLSATCAVPVANSDFYQGGKWDITGQYAGYVKLPGGGDGGWLNFGEKVKDSDVSIIVKDYPVVQDAPDGFRTVLQFTFENGKTVSFSVYYNQSGQYVIQAMGDSIFNWKTHYSLTDAEVEKLLSGGIELRVIRSGTEVSCYLDGKEIVSGADLTKDRAGADTGITANMLATVGIRHYGDAGAPVEISFEKQDKPDYVTVTCLPDADGNTVSLNKERYVRGDVVQVRDSGEGDAYPYAILVNGKQVQTDAYGNYCFEATEDEYTVAGKFAKRIFKDGGDWSEVQQNVGVLSLPNCDGVSDWLETVKDYKNLDISVTLRDLCNAEDNYRFVLGLKFSNGKQLMTGITNDASNEDATSVYQIQHVGNEDSFTGWGQPYTLSQIQSANMQSTTGVKLRVVRVGAIVDIFVDDVHAVEYDLTNLKNNGGPSGVEDLPCTVVLRLYGNKNQTVEVPFTISEDVSPVTVETAEIANGTVTVKNKNVIPGETVTLTVTPAAGYCNKSITVKNGDAEVALNGEFSEEGGSYTFVAQAGVDIYTVSAEFEPAIPKIFGSKDSQNKWDLSNQDNGSITLVQKGSNDAFVKTTANTYREAAVTVRDVAQDGNFQIQIRFYFTNGTKYQVRLYYKADAGQYEVQTMDGIINWLWIKNLSAQQTEKLKNEGVEFRAKLVGTKVELYVDDVLMAHSNPARHDLSSGIDATTTAQIQFHMVGNNGAENLELPFEVLEENVQPVFGSTDTANNWDLSNQHSGSVTLVSKGTQDAFLKTTANTYREAAITVRDVNQDGSFQMQIRFYFTNGNKYQVRMFYNADTGEYQIQNMDGITQWGWIKNLDAGQIAKLTGGEGVEFRVKIVGTKVKLYVDGQEMAYWSESRHDLSAGIDETTTAQIQFHMVGNNGAENIVMPFDLG